MSLLKELRAKQAKIVAEARTRLAEITDTTPEARAAELNTQHDAAMAEYDAIEARAAQIEAVETREAALGAVDPSRRPGREDRSQDDGGGDDGGGVSAEEQKAIFRRMMQYGAEGLTEPERRSVMGFRANLTPEMRAQTISTTGGGYTIPQGFLPEITKTMAIWGPMTDDTVVRVLRTDSGQPLPWPTVDDTANTGVDHTINTADADQDVVFGQKQLDAYIASSGMVRVPYELMQDTAFDFEGLLDDLFGERLGKRMNTKLTTGTGSSQANGIVTGSTLGKTAVSASAIASDELLDLLHSVNPAYRASPKAAWMLNDQTLKAIRKLKDGQGNYLWQIGDIKTGTPATLLDKPYRINQAMADIATGAKPMIFGDLNKYITRIVRDKIMMRLNERFADAFQVGFIAFTRYDGELTDTGAVKHLIMA